MQRYIAFALSVLCMMLLSNSVQAQDIAHNFLMPIGYPSGSGWDLNGGWAYMEDENDGPGYEYHPGEDLNLVSAPDCSEEVKAAANGVVTESADYGWGWGNIIEIKSTLSDGSNVWLIYAHEEVRYVSVGDIVHQGDLIGLVGGGARKSDGSYQYACHLHLEVRLQDKAADYWPSGLALSSIDNVIYTNPRDFINNHQTDCTDYSSYITDLKSDFGNFIGDPTNGEPHLYYQLGEHSENVCIQDYDDSGTSDGTSAIIYDYAGEARQAYLVRSGFWNLYANTCGGPEGNCNQNGVVDCGAPIGNEYSQGGSTARQDFQSCYFYWNGSSSANPYPEVGPGWFEASGWDGEVSYAFAEAYANNGARNDMGEPSDVIDGAGVHYWGNNSNLPLVQDFEGGNYGWAILMYNEEIGDAYAIHTAFWETYQRFGPGTYGAPCTDEYIGSDGKTYQDFEHYTFRYYNGNVSTQARTEGCSERAPATDDDDLIYNWPDPEDQYLFIDTDQNGVMDPCLRRGDLILCDENRDGDSDYAFSYGDGISATYFPLRFGVAVVYNYGTFYLDEDADGYTNRTITFGVSGDQGHYLGNGGALGIQRYTRYFLIDNNADGYEEWFYPFGWGLSNQHYYLADMNGDNITDLVFRQGNLFTVDTSQDGSDDFYFTYGWGDADDYYFADLISDGTDEVIVRRGDTFYVLLNESISRTCPSCSHTHDFSFHYGNGL